MTKTDSNGPTPKTTLQILKDADALLSDESKWVKGDYAHTETGKPCLVEDGSRFCISGAFMKIAGRGAVTFVHQQARESVNSIAINRGFRHVAEFNDHRKTTFADVKAVFAKAIASEEAKAGEA